MKIFIRRFEDRKNLLVNFANFQSDLDEFSRF